MEDEFCFTDAFEEGTHPSSDTDSESDSDFECQEGQQIPMNKRNFNDFLILRTVGEGAYGKVFQVRSKTNGRIYAMKVNFSG